MKTAAASLVCLVACAAAGFAEPKPASAVPIPAHELNFSPTFASHPADLTLVSTTGRKQSTQGAKASGQATSSAKAAQSVRVGAGTLVLSGSKHAESVRAFGTPERSDGLPTFQEQLPALRLGLKTTTPKPPPPEKR